MPPAYAVPDEINYQGYLTDPSGAPVNSTVNITFSLYDVDTGGTDLWNETDAVVVSDGKFTTPLGDNTTFPSGLFDNISLYLGVEIETDGEMSPRKSLTTTPFAFKTEDANTLQGISASEFVLNSLLILPGGEINAVDGIDFGNGSGSIDGLDTLIFEPGVGGITFQDGSTQDTNAVNSILAADGSGSTLDADLIDGMQATEIIDAASDEVRTPISDADLPLTISTSGSYYFAENLTHSSTTIDAIQVNADHVTIDMIGFTLSGPGKTSGALNRGIEITTQTNVTIMNGTVRDFGDDGIAEISNSGRAHHVINVKVVNNGDDGIYLLGANNQVRGCTAQDNGLATNDYGIRADTGSLLINNTATDNAGTGIYGGFGAALTNNTAADNLGTGIYGGPGATLTNNTAYNNDGLSGITGSNGATLANNSAFNNSRWGIFGNASNLIQGNTVYDNNTSSTATEGGIFVASDSRVVGNTVDSNLQIGIIVSGNDSIIDSNHVTDSTTCISFNFGGNAYRNNTAAGCTTAFGGGNIGSTTDLGGNASF